MLNKLEAGIAKKLPHLSRKIVLCYQDNEPAHTLAVSEAKMRKLVKDSTACKLLLRRAKGVRANSQLADVYNCNIEIHFIHHCEVLY